MFLDPGESADLAASLRSAFAEMHGAPPARVGRAPGRVNLIGEHTDYNGGLCLPMALPHATYAALRPRDDGRLRVASRQMDGVWEGTADLVAAGEDLGWVGYAAGVLVTLGLARTGFDLLVDSTVPLGAGLSSSAAIECAVGVAALETPDPDRLVRAAIDAETTVVGAPTGGMDQTVSVHASAGHATLIDFDAEIVRQVPLPTTDLAWLVTDTRVSHALTDGGYGQRRADCEQAARELGVASLRHADLDAVEQLRDERLRRRARHVVTEIERVARFVESLEDLEVIGELMAASHHSMRDDFEISCPELDLAVETAVAHEAIGARMTGGGFGGSSVALVRRTDAQRIAEQIDAAFDVHGFTTPQHLLAVPSDGAQVL